MSSYPRPYEQELEDATVNLVQITKPRTGKVEIDFAINANRDMDFTSRAASNIEFIIIVFVVY